jgi:hypothetical protein
VNKETARSVRWQRTSGRGRRQRRQFDGRRALPTRIVQRAATLVDNAVLLAHDLAVRAARTELATDARAATDAAQAAHLLWRVAEHYAEEVAA